MTPPSTFDTRDEAIQRLIIEPIENSGIVKDARAAYDVDGIADEVIRPRHGTAPSSPNYGRLYYYQCVDTDEFWKVVADHEYTDGGI